jgi:hypothetical protein
MSDDANAKFRVFENAARTGLLVRIHYLQTVIEDPALPEEIRRDGIRTIIDGYPLELTDTELRLTQAVSKQASDADAGTLRQTLHVRVIPRDRVEAVQLIGETMASLPKTDEDWREPPPQAT